MVQFGEAVYGQFQRGITPSTADRSTPAAQPNLVRAGLSLDAEAPGCMDSVLELWETGRVAQAPGSPAGIAHVLTQTQQAQCLVGLGECFEQLVGGYEMLWRRPDTVNVDERDWLARRAMRDAAEGGGEELKPLRGRVVRTTVDLGPLVVELDKARTPSIGQWRGPASRAAAVRGTHMEMPQTPGRAEARGGGGLGTPGLEQSNSAVWQMEDVSLHEPNRGVDECGAAQAARGGGNAPPCSSAGCADSAPWSGRPQQRAGWGHGREEDQRWYAEFAEDDGGGCAGHDSSIRALFGDEDECEMAAAGPAPYLESSMSMLMHAITGDAGLAGALRHGPACCKVHVCVVEVATCSDTGVASAVSLYGSDR